jgi:O-antigen/teichoic acid export membrane protein
MSSDEAKSVTLTPQTARGATTSVDDAKARIPLNVFCNWASYGVNLVIGLLIGPLVVHRLGNVAYGVWALVGELIGYSFLLEFGVRFAVTRYVARHHALDSPRDINRVLTAGFAITSLSAALVLVAGGVTAYLLPRLFSIPPGLVLDARLSLVLVAVGIAVSFPGSLFHGCITALSRYDLSAIRNTVPNILRALSLWYFLTHGYGLLTVAILSTLQTFLAYGLDFVMARRLLPGISIRREYFERSTLHSLVGFSVYAFIMSVSWRLIYMTDNVVVGFVLGPVAVTFYAVGGQLIGMLRDSLVNITALYAPLASQMDALKREDSLRKLFLAGTRIGFLYILAGVVGLTMVGPRFLGLWMGEPFEPRSGPILILLALEAGCHALALCCGQVLYGMNRHKVNAWLSLGNATVNLVLSTILIRWWGAVGVACGTLIPAVLIEAIVLPAFTARILGISAARFYRSVVLRSLLAAAPYAGWLWLLSHALGFVTGWGSLTLAVGSGLVLYAWLVWKVGLDDAERDLAKSWLSRVKRRMPLVSLEGL